MDSVKIEIQILDKQHDWFPVTPENLSPQSPAQRQASQSVGMAEGKKPVVLVIHRDEALLEACRRLLQPHGFEVGLISDGTQGVQRIYRTIPDLVLVGGDTPELNGYQICRLLKNDPAMRRVPLLLLADAERKMDRFWAMKAGADDFMGIDALEKDLLKKCMTVLHLYDRMDDEEKRILIASNVQNPFNIRTRLNQILDTSLVETMLMSEFRSLADLAHDASLLNHMLFNLLESILEYDAAAVFYHDGHPGPRVLTIHLPEGRRQPSVRIQAITEAFFTRFQGRGLTPEQLALQTSEVIGALDDTAEPLNYGTSYVREIRLDHQRLIGAIALYSHQKIDYSRVFPVRLVEDEIRLLMKLRHLYTHAETYAVTDGLTGLFREYHFMSVLQREMNASRRYNRPLSLALISVDHFRRLNEGWGHACGDEILRQLALLLKDSLRNADVAARLDDSRLAVLFPHTKPAQALEALERFRIKAGQSTFPWHNEHFTLTVHCGLASPGGPIDSLSALMHRTEAMLALAGEQGGDRIEISAG